MTPRLMALPQQLQPFMARSLQQASPLAFLTPQFQQTRNASILSSLNNSDAYNKRIRRGRGPASGKGKTSGRGHKGQKQHGKVPARFAGGQTPDIVVHGERGFNNVLSPELATVNLNRIQEWIDQRRIDPSKPITVRELSKSNCIHHYKDGVKVLGDGASALKQPIHLVVSRASASAIEAIEALGGTVTTRYYTHAALRHIIAQETHPFISMQWSVESGPKALLEAAGLEPTADGVREGAVMMQKGLSYRLPDPTARRDIEYYRDPAHRGYLAHLLKPSEGPSLFFRAPEERKSTAGVQKEKILPENRLW